MHKMLIIASLPSGLQNIISTLVIQGDAEATAIDVKHMSVVTPSFSKEEELHVMYVP